MRFNSQRIQDCYLYLTLIVSGIDIFVSPAVSSCHLMKVPLLQLEPCHGY
jgi:hypothetical protein